MSPAEHQRSAPVLKTIQVGEPVHKESKPQAAEQQLHAKIALFLEEELQNIDTPLYLRVAKGFRLAVLLRLSGAGTGTLLRNFHVFERPVQEWPAGLQKIYATNGVAQPASRVDVSAKTSDRTIETLTAIQARYPDGPLYLPSLMKAVSASRGKADFDTYLNSHFLALLVVPPAVRSLIFLDISAYTAVYEHIYGELEYLLDISLAGSAIFSPSRLENSLLVGMQVAGYSAQVRTYMAEQEKRRFNPTAEVPHPMDLWRAATQPRYRKQGGSYSLTNYGLAGPERNKLFKLLVVQDYPAALAILRKVSAGFPQVVLAQYLDRAVGAGGEKSFIEKNITEKTVVEDDLRS